MRPPPSQRYDAGLIFVDKPQEITHRFEVVNTTRRRVTISKVTPSCICSTSRVDKTVLAPGERTGLLLGVKLHAAYSKNSISCTLRTDDPSRPDWIYNFDFEAIPPIAIDPSRLDLGELDLDSGDSEGSAGRVKASSKVIVDVYSLGKDVSLGDIHLAGAVNGIALRLAPTLPHRDQVRARR